MKVIDKTIVKNDAGHSAGDFEITSYRPWMNYYRSMSAAAFDIETTGLSPEKSIVILAGFALPCEEGMAVKQFFAEDPSEEADVLEAAAEMIESLDTVITYNGTSFDMPFVERRRDLLRITDRHIYRPVHNLDLLTLVRRYSDIRRFTPNLRQKTLEEFIGLWETRTDEIGGGEIISAYYDYLDGFDGAVRDKILLHNSDDVLQLYRLLKVIEKTDFHRAASETGFPVSCEGFDLIVRTVSLDRHGLHIHGIQRTETGDERRCWGDDGITYVFSRDGSFAIDVITEERSGICFVSLDDLEIPETDIDCSPRPESGLLALAGNDRIFYKNINQLSIKIIERIIKSWITEN